jgi:hypothetical protein
VRLCLDEHYSSRIAEELRSRGHDVHAVSERRELRTLSDPELWSRLQSERRALLTEDVRDFVPLVREAAEAGADHWGIVFSSPRSLPRGPGTIGIFVDRLDELMRRHAGEEDFRNRVMWLQP